MIIHVISPKCFPISWSNPEGYTWHQVQMLISLRRRMVAESVVSIVDRARGASLAEWLDFKVVVINRDLSIYVYIYNYVYIYIDNYVYIYIYKYTLYTTH